MNYLHADRCAFSLLIGQVSLSGASSGGTSRNFRLTQSSRTSCSRTLWFAAHPEPASPTRACL
eukprot:6192447-Pleurochrysis_carterae.AAC.1